MPISINDAIKACPLRRRNPTNGFYLLNAQSAAESAGGVRLVTHIGDRESDLYEEWSRVPDAQNHVLVRVCQDRRLSGQADSLYTHLSQQPGVGTYSVAVLADPRTGRTAREAWLSVQLALVQIQRPDNLSAQDYPASVSLNAVEAKEVNPPVGQEPIQGAIVDDP